ncbi:aldose epimerase family protein [Pseudodesulfovibrio sediminis]|uniref:Aldose 1-epimerase n=1 Tax=Pseudodesulfovibrio sediminis TaxID=2810563 RepID=A0ABM7P988_9BACT|nr:aldose epimerase family protein [Pseudodesulfovibrio sediminis]BCS89606.1 aldose 1-epimerase [Pseudodesulfovibrio sediminis]
MTITSTQWGALPDGTPVELYTLTNDHGLEVSIATYGGAITRLLVPDGAGNRVNVTLGYDSLAGYCADQSCMGVLVGRVANRIAQARFTLNGTRHVLDRNHGKHQLHGGSRGFNSRVWEAEANETDAGPQITLTRVSPDGEQGFPGTLRVAVDFTLVGDSLHLDFGAITDAPTMVSMTNHSYFNLAGRPGADCLDHCLRLASGQYLETDADLVPTGAVVRSFGTPLDFRELTPIGKRIKAPCAALTNGAGYDHYHVLADTTLGLKFAAQVLEPESRREMEVWTTAPGIHFYSGNHLHEALSDKHGMVYGPHSGFCLEAHGYVDAPNQPGFPSIQLDPGVAYSQTTLYKFPVK